MKIYLASWLYEPSQGEALTESKYWNRLLSYFHTRDRESELRSYVRTGKNSSKGKT